LIKLRAAQIKSWNSDYASGLIRCLRVLVGPRTFIEVASAELGAQVRDRARLVRHVRSPSRVARAFGVRLDQQALFGPDVPLEELLAGEALWLADFVIFETEVPIDELPDPIALAAEFGGRATWSVRQATGLTDAWLVSGAAEDVLVRAFADEGWRVERVAI